MPAVVVAGPVFAVLQDSSGNDLGVVDISGVKHLQTEVNRIVNELPAGTQVIGKVGIDATTLGGLAEEATLSAVATDVAAIEVLLTSIDGKDFATQTTLATLLSESAYVSRTGEVTASPAANTLLGRLKALTDLASSLDGKDFATQTTLATLLTEATFAAEDFASETTLLAADGRLTTIDAVLDAIKDVDGIKKITDELPAGTQQIGLVAQGTKAALVDAWPVVATDAAGNAISSQIDAGVRRLEIAGKVSVIGAAPPPSTTDATIFADTPLVVGADDTIYVIPNGETYHLQEIIAGNEDPTKGCSVEVIFDNAGTELLVARVYRAGVTLTDGYPNRTESRDGTTMIGNAGGTNRIIVRRLKYSGSDIAIDAVVRGYTT